MEDRIISKNEKTDEKRTERSLRPRFLNEYIGQDKIKKNIKIFIAAAKERKESLEHILLCGPPGLGKTTLANILSNEMGVNIKITSGPAIERAGDLAAIVTNLSENDIFFIDEIHRLPRAVEEILYPVMEDYELDIIIGKGPSARSIRLELPNFTLIGATTKTGKISSPLRDRFGFIGRLEHYNHEELIVIVKRAATFLGCQVGEKTALEIAKRSRGTPRVANRLLRRVRDWAQIKSKGDMQVKIAKEALEALEIDEIGLDGVDRKYLKTIIEKFSGGPVGLETIAAAISEESDTIEDVYEPYLLQLGFIERTPRGRTVTKLGYEHLKIPLSLGNQEKLF